MVAGSWHADVAGLRATERKSLTKAARCSSHDFTHKPALARPTRAPRVDHQPHTRSAPLLDSIRDPRIPYAMEARSQDRISGIGGVGTSAADPNQFGGLAVCLFIRIGYNYPLWPTIVCWPAQLGVDERGNDGKKIYSKIRL
jgi:hypothetical protein